MKQRDVRLYSKTRFQDSAVSGDASSSSPPQPSCKFRALRDGHSKRYNNRIGDFGPGTIKIRRISAIRPFWGIQTMNRGFVFRRFARSAGLLLVVQFLSSMCCLGQEMHSDKDRLPLLQDMRDLGRGVVVFDRLDIVVGDIERMAKDLSVDSLTSEFLRMDKGLCDVTYPGLVYYIDNNLAHVRIKSRSGLARLLDLPDEEPEDGKLYSMPIADYLPLSELLNIRDEGTVNGDALIFANNWGVERDSAAEIDAWRAAGDNLLWPKLDSKGQAIVSGTGIAFISGFSDGGEAFRDYFSDFERMQAESLNPKEVEWFRDFGSVISMTDRQVLGVRYHERVLEIRGRAQLPEGTTFDGLIKTEVSEVDWKPDLGLRNENLVLALAFHTDAFPNPAPMRFLPRMGLYYGAEQEQLQWLQGNMVGVLAELIGDSWNELTAGRLALYETPDAEKLGQFAIVGVVDSRDSAVVLDELDRIASLTGPLANAVKADERDEEIRRLIEELGSDDYEIAARAETRLVLAGRAAIEPLKTASRDWTGDRSNAAQRILRRMEAISPDSPEQQERLTFSDPAFWTTLNPGLWLERNTGEFAGFDSHTVHISADPSKTEEEVQGAVAIMVGLFGPAWEKVRVVQIDDHFVFMIGSDDALLESVVQRVQKGTGELAQSMDGVGNCSRTGQIQAWIEGRRIFKLFLGEDLPQEMKVLKGEERPIWLAMDVGLNGMDVKTLIPIEQIIPAVRMLMF
jgi:hypothetical protein